MSILQSRRSVMTLFTEETDPYAHQVRIVLAEKGVAAEMIEVDMNHKPDELLELNPYGSVPTLVDRDLVLYESHIILEYLEERFPYPPLMPVYPVARGRCRLMLSRVDRDWYSLYYKIRDGGVEQAKAARKDLYDSLVSVAPVFADTPFFLSEEYTLVDCSLAALLWRLPSIGIELPPQAKAIHAYAKRIFSRELFQASLTEAEKEMHEVGTF
jgi:RNA polymerase-associated protein